jgi:hypothetical protein
VFGKMDATATLFAQYEAKKIPEDEAVFVVLNPRGKTIGVIASGTGRRVPPRVASRAKRLVRDALPEFSTKRRKRTSKAPMPPTSGSRTTRRKKRSSKGGRRKRTSRTAEGG